LEWKLRRATLDHIQPKSRYMGNHQLIAASCGDCNSRKGNRSPYPCEIFYGVVNSILFLYINQDCRFFIEEPMSKISVNLDKKTAEELEEARINQKMREYHISYFLYTFV